MIQIYADGVLAYDSRLDDYELIGLRVTRGVNKGGTAEIVMPPYHPAYSQYIGYRTIVEIYRDGVLRFRGRALYPIDDFYNQRTVVCEGELCLLQDAILRPYLYETNPAAIFSDVVTQYNNQVDEFKQFKLGEVTVTDPNNYIRLESESAESALAVVNKLVERCGGYVVFTTDQDGARRVHWLASTGRESGQAIEIGENLLDFASSGANTDLATVLIPYGAKDETTGERVTIESVNGGKDYIVDETTASIRGLIAKAVTWDDVTEPGNLLTKARQYLNECKLLVTSLTLTALDLSWVDKDIDSYEVGDRIRVRSDAHNLDEYFQLTEQTEDLLRPEQSTVNLGKEIRTLTQMDVAGDDAIKSALTKVPVEIRRDIEINVAKAAAESEQRLTSIIEQKASSIRFEVSGSLGSKAEIKLAAFGAEVQTAELDLRAVRAAFANDTSSVAISGGTITFNSNTLIVNSTNLQVGADGTIRATNAVLSGTATTENGDYKSELSGGRLRFFYEGTEYGGIASGYLGGDPNARGVAVRLEKGAKYIGFSKADAEGDGYDLSYCINYGANPGGRTERHIFHGSTYFDGKVTINNGFSAKGHIGINGAYSVKFKNNAGEYINGLGKYADDSMFAGQDEYKFYVYGSEVHLGSTSEGAVYIGGASSAVNSPCTFNHFTYFASNAHFLVNTIISNNTGMRGQNADGTDTIWVAAVNSTNEVILGDLDYTTYIQGASILLGTGSSTVTVRSNLGLSGSLQLNNGYGVQVKNAAGSNCYLLSMNSSNQVSVGNLDYPMFLRGTSVTVNTGNLILANGSVCVQNGYGVQGKDTSGTSVYILSVNSSNQVSVGTSSLPLYLRGSGVYLSSSGATVTSDRRKKHSIEELGDAYEAMLDKLTPVRFKYNDGTSDRFHVGYIAQDVKEALEGVGLTTQDFGGFVDVNKDGEELGLIYTQFIAMQHLKIRRLEQRLAALEGAKNGG